MKIIIAITVLAITAIAIMSFSNTVDQIGSTAEVSTPTSRMMDQIK